MFRLNDRLYMTIAVDFSVKPQNKQKRSQKPNYNILLPISFFSVFPYKSLDPVGNFLALGNCYFGS